jgi:hypothetical protein
MKVGDFYTLHDDADCLIMQVDIQGQESYPEWGFFRIYFIY